MRLLEMIDLADMLGDDTTAPKLVSSIVALAVATTAPSARESQCVNLGQTAKIVRWV
jgi:hypothetical protein